MAHVTDARSLARKRSELMESIAGEDLLSLIEATGLPKPLLMTLTGYSAASVKLLTKWEQIEQAPACFLAKLQHLADVAKAS